MAIIQRNHIEAGTSKPADQEELERLARHPLSLALLQHYQRNFPIVDQPFKAIAEQFGVQEEAVIHQVNALYKHRLITRIGPIFDHRRAGASLLAAVHTKPSQQDRIAAIINSFSGVNHNYARSHFYNLWFVVTAPDQQHLHQVLDQIELQTGCRVLRLPMEKSYHIDLSFPLDHSDHEALPLANGQSVVSMQPVCSIPRHSKSSGP